MMITEEKALGLFMMKLGSILGVFAMYGMDIYIPEAKEQIKIQALELHRQLKEVEGESK